MKIKLGEDELFPMYYLERPDETDDPADIYRIPIMFWLLYKLIEGLYMMCQKVLENMYSSRWGND